MLAKIGLWPSRILGLGMLIYSLHTHADSWAGIWILYSGIIWLVPARTSA